MTKQELTQLQSLSLDLKIAKTKLRISEFVSLMGEDNVYISFSGGKDSTVLLDIVRQLYPNIPAVFSNTGLEFPELVMFVKTFENVIFIKPEKTFKQVLEAEGYPVLSKKTSRMLHDLQNPTENNKRSRSMYLSDFILDEQGNPKDVKNNGFRLAKKYRHLIDSEFKFSNKCCDYLKKNPMKKYEKTTKRKPIIGTMANESQQRESVYLKQGCISFKDGFEKCTPMGFWTEQDVLNYIKTFKIPYASVYGEIIEENGILKTTGENRTGCIFCLFGIQYEKGENRIQRLKNTHPQLYKYCIEKLKIGEVCEEIGVKYE